MSISLSFFLAPPTPNDTDVKNKIITQSANADSIPTQYVIIIDTSLFSDDYGIVHTYLIYIRQGKMSFFCIH